MIEYGCVDNFYLIKIKNNFICEMYTPVCNILRLSNEQNVMMIAAHFTLVMCIA